jgi:2-polyprenyl-3-methyl-5-hydroxy-6-metoxy-1,4-benzoquinol methylase
MENFGASWTDEFEAVIASIFADEAALDAALHGYVSFALDSMRRQKVFEITNEYPHKTYCDAANEVYRNDAYMMHEYLPGLLLSHFLWLHHYRQLQFFDSSFLAPMALLPGLESLRFAEIGVGTGVYSRRILSRVQRAIGTGYDISLSSCKFAQRHLECARVSERFSMRQQDVLLDPIEPVPWIVCVEMLEHLEQPVEFLHSLRRGLMPGGRAFVSAALNAAHADHIYLYRDAGEVWRHLEEVGFRLEQSFVAAAYAPPRPGVPVPMAASFVVY